MGTRLFKLEWFDNVGQVGNNLGGDDAPLFPLVLTSPHLHSVMLASTALHSFAPALLSVAARLNHHVGLFHLGARRAPTDAFDALFLRLRPYRLLLFHFAATPTAYNNLTRGPAATSLFELLYTGDDGDGPQNLGYLAGLHALRNLSLNHMACASLPGHTSTVRRLVLNHVTFEPACYDTIEDSMFSPSTPFQQLEELVLNDVTESRMACAIIVRNSMSLRTLELSHFQTIENTPAATRLLHTLGSCRLTHLTTLAIAEPGLVGMWSHVIIPLLCDQFVHLESLKLCRMLDDDKLFSLKLLALASVRTNNAIVAATSDTDISGITSSQTLEMPLVHATSVNTNDNELVVGNCIRITATLDPTSFQAPTLILTRLSFADNPAITVEGILAFVTAVHLTRLKKFDIRQRDRLPFSPLQRLALSARLPPLCRILAGTIR
jgi:hypothetical protein